MHEFNEIPFEVPTSEDLFMKKVFQNHKIGTASNGTINKDGLVYHVVTNSWRKLWIFYGNSAKYRPDLLCELCRKNGVTILYSLTMMNHTHEVFITPSWEVLSSMLRSLNSCVSRYIRETYGDRIRNRKNIFSYEPTYVIVDEIVYLFCLGKYIYDNPQYMIAQGRNPPDSCFWMLQSGHFIEPYNARIYETLFGLTAHEVLNIYSTMRYDEVYYFALDRFHTWTQEDNDRLFLRKGR